MDSFLAFNANIAHCAYCDGVRLGDILDCVLELLEVENMGR